MSRLIKVDFPLLLDQQWQQYLRQDINTQIDKRFIRQIAKLDMIKLKTSLHMLSKTALPVSVISSSSNII